MDLIDILKVILIAASPISELRGAIPVAIIVYDFPWFYAYLIGVIGNILPVPFILLFLSTFTRLLMRVRALKPFLDWLFARIRSRDRMIVRYERIGLALFVSIPFPITGAWTGSIIAVLLGLRFRFAFISIIAGVLMAGIIVTVLTMLGWTVFGLIESPAG